MCVPTHPPCSLPCSCRSLDSRGAACPQCHCAANIERALKGRGLRRQGTVRALQVAKLAARAPRVGVAPFLELTLPLHASHTQAHGRERLPALPASRCFLRQDLRTHTRLPQIGGLSLRDSAVLRHAGCCGAGNRRALHPRALLRCALIAAGARGLRQWAAAVTARGCATRRRRVPMGPPHGVPIGRPPPARAERLNALAQRRSSAEPKSLL